MIDLNLYLYCALVFVFALIVHEFGHYCAFRYFGFKPLIRWHSGALCIGEDAMYSLNARQLVIVGAAGVVAGFVAIAVLSDSLVLWLLYCVGCCYDLAVISTYAEFWNSSKTMYQIDKANLQKHRPRKRRIDHKPSIGYKLFRRAKSGRFEVFRSV